MKFKPGDEVVCTKISPQGGESIGTSYGEEFTVGKTYVVRSMEEGGRFMVMYDDRGSTTNGWVTEYFEIGGSPW